MRDEVHDFELNTRGVFGGRGLIDDDRLFFAIGGASGGTPSDSSAIEQFHQFTGALTPTNDLAGSALTPPLPNARRDFATATLDDGRVFLIGGRSGAAPGTLITTNVVLEFNPRANTVIARNSTGFTPRHSLGAAVVRTSAGPRIYAIGGYTSTLSTQGASNVVEEFNPASGTWRAVASLPTAVAEFGIAVGGGINTAEPLQLIHVVSGNTGSEGTPSLVNANPVQRFQVDPSGPGTWSAFSVPGLTLRRLHGAATVLRGVTTRIFVMGGRDATGAALDTVDEYLSQAVVVVATPHTAMPAPRASFAISSSLSTNQIYVVGGVDNTNSDQATFFEYTVANQGPTAGPPGTPSGAWLTRGSLSAARHGLALSIPPGVTNLLRVQSAGRDSSQDAISLFVSRRIRSSRAPVAPTDPSAMAGQTLFNTVGLVLPGFSCATCHTAPRWTVSQVDYTAPPSPEVGLGFGSQRVIGAELRQTAAQGPNPGQLPGVLINVGTFTPNLAGGRVNEIRVNAADAGQAIAPLGANGFNVPSLLSINETAPYFYNGLATSLSEVMDGSQDNNGGVRQHFVTSSTDRANLIAFLRSIDSKDTAPEVVAEPFDQPVCPGATATFTASASGTPAPAIQWQQSTNGGSTFTNIIGETSSSLVFTVDATQNGNLYRAVFTNRLGTVTSRAAMLSVTLLVTSNPVSKTASAGATVSFTAAASGTPAPTVRWQSSSNGGATFSNISGANSTTLTFMATPFDNGHLFRAVFTNACGSVNTSAATLTVRQFTDPTLLKGTTPIRAIHIEELRARVDEQRARFMLPVFPWTDKPLTIGSSPVREIHVTELREALRQAYVAANRTVPVYTDAPVSAGQTAIKAVHIEELRTAVVALE